MGFLPRPGTRWYQAGGQYMPRPQGGPFGWVRQFFFQFHPLYIESADGRTESWRILISPFNVQTQSGEQIQAVIMPKFERLDEDFEIADGVVIPPGEYEYTRFRVGAQSSRHRPWRVGATVWFGDFFIVWNHGWRHPLASEDRFSLHPVNDQIVVKLRWTFRW